MSRVVPAGRSVLPVKLTVPPLLVREVVDVVMVMDGAAPSTVTSKTFDLVMKNTTMNY